MTICFVGAYEIAYTSCTRIARNMLGDTVHLYEGPIGDAPAAGLAQNNLTLRSAESRFHQDIFLLP
jgi:hypothetical protein